MSRFLLAAVLSCYNIFMGRKKKEEKNTKESQNEESGFEWEEVLGSDAKRSIAAVFLFMFGALFLIAFFGAGGALGGMFDAVLGSAFGWGRWLLPVVLFIFGSFFLRRRETALSDIAKFVGLGMVYVSGLGFLHLFLGDTPKELLTAAQRGDGGGYIGFALAYLFLEFTGRIAGAVILAALFFSGLIAAFNVSLMHFLADVRGRAEHIVIRKRKSGEDDGVDADDSPEIEEGGIAPESDEETDPSLTDETPGRNPLEEANISTIKFPDERPEEADAAENVQGLQFAHEEDGQEEEATPSDMPRPRKHRKEQWEFPPLGLLENKSEKENSGDVERNKNIIKSTFKYFNIDGEMGDPQIGPTVTQYTFSPAFGTRLSKITSLSDNLALALAKHPIRIEAPIPKTSLVGIEVPNDAPAKVRMRDILMSDAWKNRTSKHLSVVLGEDVSGKYIVGDLGSMPHLLVAGATGSGKSVCINSILLSLLYQNSPDELQLILVDPKRVELSLYNGLPHLKSGKVITENKHVVNALRYATAEMDRRYKLLESIRARDIASYHEKYARGERRRVTDSEGKTREEDLDPLPYIVVVIDEMADLMIAHGKEVEAVIVRLAQMSRAVGIHLVLATQRPSVEVVTGLIKANIPARVAFLVTNQIDSRTILDTSGAEKLLGRGDMLYSPPGVGQPSRVQGAFISEHEVRDVVSFFHAQGLRLGKEEIGEDFAGADEKEKDDEALAMSGDDFSQTIGGDDPEYEAAKAVVIETGRAATTFLQRKLSIGYGKAAKFLDRMEEDGIVTMAEGANKGRKVLVGPKAGMSGASEYDDPIADQASRDKWQM